MKTAQKLLCLAAVLTGLLLVGCATKETKPTQNFTPIVKVSSTETTRKASCMCGKLTVTFTGADPERRSLCHCNSCKLRTGSVFSVQARVPRTQASINGPSTAYKFPSATGMPVNYRSCDSGGVTYHFCPECGSTVYWDITAAPDVIGVAVGALTDTTFPAPNIAGFEAYKHPWAMNISDVPMEHHE
ncbi:MAG TPA: GFA family protein [Chryseolinea sp.]|nr:GFA family protein [Chryseolinea sp.]